MSKPRGTEITGAGRKRLAAFVADDVKDEKPLTHLTFLLNFFDELRRDASAANSQMRAALRN